MKRRREQELTVLKDILLVLTLIAKQQGIIVADIKKREAQEKGTLIK